jgi:hypothetical protein
MGGNRKGQKQGAARFQTPVFRRTPTPNPVENCFSALPPLVTFTYSTTCILSLLTK